jgi:hypothetical protein
VRVGATKRWRARIEYERRSSMTVPTVHLNGTGRESLRQQYQAAYLTLAPAIAALQQTTPHGRDYYPQDDGQINGPAYQAARAEHAERIHRLETVQQELLALYRAVASPCANVPASSA